METTRRSFLQLIASTPLLKALHLEQWEKLPSTDWTALAPDAVAETYIESIRPVGFTMKLPLEKAQEALKIFYGNDPNKIEVTTFTFKVVGSDITFSFNGIVKSVFVRDRCCEMSFVVTSCPRINEQPTSQEVSLDSLDPFEISPVDL